jgi:dTDP-4-amino-4,6-dideoxygalactose transaminase
MKVPILDLMAQFREIDAELRAAVERVLFSQHFILGPEVEALETEIAGFCGVEHGIAVSNGSDALVATLMALNIGPGDEVIVPTFTFFATAGAVSRVGATPVFVDILPDTFNIDPDSFAGAITAKTRAIIPVHLFGHCADMESLKSLASDHGIVLIEDAAQAIGATLNGRPSGSFGLAGTLSFYPTKNLSAIGEAGMILTNDDELAVKLRIVRNHGQGEQYRHDVVGGNFRMDAIQAAALRVKMLRLIDWTEQRRRNARRYDDALRNPHVELPVTREGCKHVYHQYTVRSKYRDALRLHLTECGVGSGIYYPIPLHLQPCYANLGYPQGAFPVAEKACAQVLSIPVYQGMTRDQQDHVIESINSFEVDST